MAAVFPLDVPGLACSLFEPDIFRTVAGWLYFMPGSFPMTNHVSANSSRTISFGVGAGRHLERNNRKVNGLRRLTVHRVLYYGSNEQRNKFESI